MKHKNILIFLLASFVLLSNLASCQLEDKHSPKRFSFKVTDISNDSSTSYEDKIFKIDIYSSNTKKLIQSIEYKIESVSYDFFLEIDTTCLEDVNFDVYSDLLLPSEQGAMGRNNFSSVYLFDSLQNKFQYSELFSNICNLRINQEDQTIEGFIFNGGDPNFTFTTYDIVNNSPVIKKIINQHFDIIETSYYENGNFLYKKIETVKDK